MIFIIKKAQADPKINLGFKFVETAIGHHNLGGDGEHFVKNSIRYSRQLQTAY
ncbi:MAG: hypothetical protein IPJ40_09615 [Saprospirales bacterium]|nr:hypothetical protein [Saprospirales bacterium]